MQIGRWNHQGAGGDSHGGNRGSGGGAAFDASEFTAPRARGGRPSGVGGGRGRGPRGFGGRSSGRGPSTSSGRSRKKGGFGAFGETEAEIAKFINRGVAIEAPQEVFEPE